MTEQKKAEAYVRQERPALMELTKGCEIKLKRDKWTKCFIAEEATPGVPAVVHLYGAPSVYLIELDGKNLKIIGHPINLQDWLGVLGKKKKYRLNQDGEMWFPGDSYMIENRINFNMDTGQPATEADYKAFNDEVQKPRKRWPNSNIKI